MPIYASEGIQNTATMVSRSAQASFEETPWADIKFSINNGFPIYEYFDFSKYTADGIKLEELKQAQ